jgi:hypothetical protein
VNSSGGFALVPSSPAIGIEAEEEPMTDLEYAPDGYHFARISTPDVFREYLLPIDGKMTAEEETNYEELQTLAEKHGTSINCGSYRIG